MHTKTLIIFAVLISTIYIYYTVQQDKDRIYQTLYREPNKTPPCVNQDKKIKELTVTKNKTNQVINSPSKEIVIEPKIEKEAKAENNISKIETTLVVETPYEEPIKEKRETKENLESIIQQALKGINTSKIIKIEEK